MIKKLITVPDELYRKAKLVAKVKEWSLAEVFRRGLEYMTRVHHPEDREECLTDISGVDRTRI